MRPHFFKTILYFSTTAIPRDLEPDVEGTARKQISALTIVGDYLLLLAHEDRSNGHALYVYDLQFLFQVLVRLIQQLRDYEPNIAMKSVFPAQGSR